MADLQGGGKEVFRLDAAKLLQRPVERALRGAAGTVNGDLEAVEFFVRHVFGRVRFEMGAAAQPPGGMDDLAGERIFERRCGQELGEVAAVEVGEEFRSSGRMKAATENRPNFRAFCETRAFPSAVTGPVEY